MKTVTLDPGHGGHDSGAVSPHTGQKEKDFNLSMALKVKELLLRSVNVFMTREDDTFIPLVERARTANTADSDLFLSFHANSADRKSARGAECWTTRGETKADMFANTLFHVWTEDFPGSPFRRDMSDGDVDFEAGFTVLKHTDCPAVLWEFGFMSNREDSLLLSDTIWQERAAMAIAGGILLHLGIEIPNTPNVPNMSPLRNGLDETITKLTQLRNTI